MAISRILIASVIVSLHIFHFSGSAQTPLIQAPAGSPSAQAPASAPSTESPAIAPSTESPASAPCTESPAIAPSTPTIDCEEACDYRCHLASRQNMCKRACGTCCERCLCVPPGTYGHYEVCPCYANMTTHGGRHKCP